MKHEIDPDKAIKNLPWFYFGIGITVSVFASIFSLIIIISHADDITNVTTLVIEIGFGIAISVTVYLYSKRQHNENKNQQTKISELISEIRKIEERQQQLIETQEKLYRRRIAYNTNNIRSITEHILENLLKEYIEILKIYKERKRKIEIIKIIKKYGILNEDRINRFQLRVQMSLDFLEPAIIGRISSFHQGYSRRNDIIKTNMLDLIILEYDDMVNSLEGILMYLPKFVKPPFGPYEFKSILYES